MGQEIRNAAVAGRWYPGTASALTAAVDQYLAVTSDVPGDVQALVVPHAGLRYSGAIAAHAYRLLRGRAFHVIVLVGPSHFVGFGGVSVWPRGGFATPLGVAAIDEGCAVRVMQATRIVHDHPAAHAREHSLEMQLPFLQRLAPGVPIVPLVMGDQGPDTARELGDALATVLDGRHALLVASTDLSHYHDRATASAMDAVVVDCLSRFDAGGLQAALTARPDHACGGGPAVAVMRAARLLGARDALVLQYGDSGDVSGDTSSVVGYVAAAFGRFTDAAPTKEA